MKKWVMPQVKIDQFVANEYVAGCAGVSVHCGAVVKARELGIGVWSWIYTAPDEAAGGGISISHPVLSSNLITGANAHSIGEPCTETINLKDYSQIAVGSADTFFDANGNQTDSHAPENGYAIHKHTTSDPKVFVYAFEKMNSSGYPTGDGYHWFLGKANPNS